MKTLVDAGLDHVQITLESHDQAIHDLMVAAPGAWEETVAGIRNVVASRLYIMTNTTLLTHNSPYIEKTLHFLGELGVPTVGINALIYSGKGEEVGTVQERTSLLHEKAREITTARSAVDWYTRLILSFNPSLDLGVKGAQMPL